MNTILLVVMVPCKSTLPYITWKKKKQQNSDTEPFYETQALTVSTFVEILNILFGLSSRLHNCSTLNK